MATQLVVVYPNDTAPNLEREQPKFISKLKAKKNSKKPKDD